MDLVQASPNLEMLEQIALGKNMIEAAKFLRNVRRLSALDTYLSSFVDGIKSFTKGDGMLHVQLTQHMTSTGRFSGPQSPTCRTCHVEEPFLSSVCLYLALTEVEYLRLTLHS